jgi:hypothetical protein
MTTTHTTTTPRWRATGVKAVALDEVTGQQLDAAIAAISSTYKVTLSRSSAVRLLVELGSQWLQRQLNGSEELGTIEQRQRAIGVLAQRMRKHRKAVKSAVKGSVIEALKRQDADRARLEAWLDRRYAAEQAFETSNHDEELHTCP